MPSKEKLQSQIKKQESKLKELQNQIIQQQELLEEILRETKQQQLSPQSSNSPFSFLKEIKLDPEKLIQIAAIIGSLYTNNSGKEQEQ